MASAVHFSRGSKFLLKGTIFIIFCVALLSIFSFAYRRYKNTDDPEDRQIENAEKRTMENNTNSLVGPEHRIDFSRARRIDFEKSVCYRGLPRPVAVACLPFYVLVDIEGVNAYILQNFLKECDDIMTFDPPRTSYFDPFPNMDDVRQPELLAYLQQFRPFTRWILSGGIRDNERIYGDMGKLGPRPYLIDPNSDVAVPVLSPQNLLHDMNPDLRIIFPIRNPTIATFVAYCAANHSLDDFEAEVDMGLAIFNACKQQMGFVPCEFRPDMHNPNYLKVRVVKYIYSFWIRRMTEIFSVDKYKIVLYEDLVRPGTQVATLKDILHFLTFNETTDADIEAKIGNGGGGGSEGGSGVSVPPKCDISKIPAGAKEKLDKFYEAFNLILKEEFNEGYFNGWSYPDVQR